MYQVRLHGIGGQGVALAADLLGLAAVREGLWAHSFPFFGTEIRGGGVTAFIRISNSPIHNRSFIDCPDLVVIFSDYLLSKELCAGVKENTIVLVNSASSPEALFNQQPGKLLTIDAQSLSRDIPDCRMVNCILLGAILRFIPQVSITSVEQAIQEKLSPKLAAVNIQAARLGYQVFSETIVRYV